MKKPSTRTLESLEEFKSYMIANVKQHCRDTYSINTYSQYINPLVDELLENLEAHIETMSEESIHEEELAYGELSGE